MTRDKRKWLIAVYLWIAMVIIIIGAMVIRSCGAAEFFSDNFDGGEFNPGWAGISKAAVMASDNPLGGTGFSARGVYNNVEDANYLTINPDREDYYLRYYIFYAQGMRYWSCKIMRMGYWSETESYYVNVGWATYDAINEDGLCFSIRSTDAPNRDFFFNFSHERNKAAGQWLCFEFHIKLNTPGQLDGMLEAWINGEQAFTKDNLNIQGNISAKPGYHWIFGNYSNGVTGTAIPGAPWYVWIDNVMYSTDYIGPIPIGVTPTSTESATRSPTATAIPSPTPTPTQSVPKRDIRKFPINSDKWEGFYRIAFALYWQGWQFEFPPTVIGDNVVFWLIRYPKQIPPNIVALSAAVQVIEEMGFHPDPSSAEILAGFSK